MKSKSKKVLYLMGITAGGLITGFILFVYVSLKLSVATTDGTKNLPGLIGEVEITFDKMGIPQIWAANELDAYFALGYQHSADRLFQMELTRRFSQGRLSELLGSITVEIDAEQRRLGHTRMADAAMENLSDDVRTKLEAYCNGINTYFIDCLVRPFELKLLPTAYETWTVRDCLALLSFQSWYSHSLMSRDKAFLDLAETVGIEMAGRLVPRYPDWAPMTVTDKSVSVSSIQEAVVGSLFGSGLRPLQMSTASNAWVISPSRSATGSALLASDPHLETTRLPQFWYYVGMHISETGLDAIGVTAPGFPAIIMGHNLQAAFAFTASGIDLTEYYVERINPDDPNQYRGVEGWKEFERFTDTILISDRFPEIIEIRLTDNGPIMFERPDSNMAISLRWTGFDADLNNSFQNAFRLAATSNFNDFRKHVTGLGALSANWLYADRNGTTGYQLGPSIPIRTVKANNMPLAGWVPENKWRGYYPLDETPYETNPERGWLASCNNKPAGNLSYDLPGNYFTNRILRIESLLNSKDRFTVEDMWRYQLDRTDTYSLRWRDEVADLLRDADEPERAEQLRQWDGVASSDSWPTLFINLFLRELNGAIFGDELGRLSGYVSTVRLDAVFHSDDSEWIDDIRTSDTVEDRNKIAGLAIRKALALAGNRTWGEAHSLTMRHPLAVVPVLGSLLGLAHGPWPWEGSSGTLNSSFTTASSDSTFTSIVGPSWRLVVDLGNIDAATMVLPAGNSGNPMSDHFFDFNQMWREGGRWNVPISREEVLKKTVSSLILAPED